MTRRGNTPTPAAEGCGFRRTAGRGRANTSRADTCVLHPTARYRVCGEAARISVKSPTGRYINRYPKQTHALQQREEKQQETHRRAESEQGDKKQKEKGKVTADRSPLPSGKACISPRCVSTPRNKPIHWAISPKQAKQASKQQPHSTTTGTALLAQANNAHLERPDPADPDLELGAGGQTLNVVELDALPPATAGGLAPEE
jgi:hypothetical protein